MKTSIVIFALAALVAVTTAEILEGQFNRPIAEYPSVDDTQLDPTANSAIFRHDGDMTYVVHDDKSKGKDKRNAVYYEIAQWPGGIIPYYISPEFNVNERRVILLAMQEWESKTCIRFVPKEEVPQNLFCIEIMPSTPGYCASFVGRLYYYPNQCQGVALGAGCVHHRIVLHELGHAIGFHHEHNRPDRDEYINVNLEENEDLARQVDRLYYVRTLGLGYDYASIMHYGSLGGLIDPIHGVPFGNAQELSPLDIIKTNTLYNCPTRDKQPASRLEPIPPTVSVPHGTQCGKYLRVDKDGSFRFPGSSEHSAGQNCTYVLEAPKGYGFDFTLPDLTRFESAYWPCRPQYVQFLSGATLSNVDIVRYPYVSNGRICERSDRENVFRVENNVVTINYHSDSTPFDFNVSFQLRDINECSRNHHCHSCTNLKGAYSCDCDDGYYHSYASNSCYDVNECSFDNGGCDQKCMNRAGGYECACDTGYLQGDGKTCGPERPDSEPAQLAPGTIRAPSTAPTTVPPTTPTTPKPTTPEPTTPKPTTPEPTTPKPTTPEPTTPKPTTPEPTTPKPTTPEPTTPKPTTPEPTTPKPTTPVPTTPKPTTPPTTPPTRDCPLPDTAIDKRTCFGGVVSGESFSPVNFPNFVTNSDCRQLILASDKEQVRFKYIDLPPDSTCDQFSITVRRQFDNNGVVLRRICGDELRTCGDIVVPLKDRYSLVSMSGTLSAEARGFVATIEPQP